MNGRRLCVVVALVSIWEVAVSSGQVEAQSGSVMPQGAATRIVDDNGPVATKTPTPQKPTPMPEPSATATPLPSPTPTVTASAEPSLEPSEPNAPISAPVGVTPEPLPTATNTPTATPTIRPCARCESTGTHLERCNNDPAEPVRYCQIPGYDLVFRQICLRNVTTGSWQWSRPEPAPAGSHTSPRFCRPTLQNRPRPVTWPRPNGPARRPSRPIRPPSTVSGTFLNCDRPNNYYRQCRPRQENSLRFCFRMRNGTDCRLHVERCVRDPHGFQWNRSAGEPCGSCSINYYFPPNGGLPVPWYASSGSVNMNGSPPQCQEARREIDQARSVEPGQNPGR